MSYIDGFVLPIPKKHVETYRGIAKLAAKVWMEHGALEYREYVGDDLNIKSGVPFGRMMKARRGETVVFAWIVYRSRAHRDRVLKKVLKDERLQVDPKTMPFDMKRMAYGGFISLVEG